MPKFKSCNHFGFLTNRVGRLIGQYIQNQPDTNMNFPSSCIGIMAELWNNDGMTQKELGTSLIKTKSSINKMLNFLIADGMIIKRPDSDDKRSKRIFLTQKGKNFKYLIENKSQLIEQQYLTNHTAKEIDTAKKVLASLYSNLSENIKNKTSIINALSNE